MPELPEVETTCRGIAPFLIGNKVQKIVVREHRLRWPLHAQFLQAQLKNQRILAVGRRAKYIVISLPTGTLVIHLGMSGTLSIVNSDTSLKKHDHVDWVLNNRKILRFNDPRRFGAILFAQDSLPGPLAHLGPEPLEKSFNANYLYHKALKHRGNIKTFLMNQRHVVGIGNIYANESLFLAKIHPEKISKTLSLAQCKQLHRAIQTVLRAAIKKGGTTLKDFRQSDGKPGYFSNELKIYNRQGQPCLHCHSPICLVTVGQRATYFCSKCQIP